jgi:hypothetical protein
MSGRNKNQSCRAEDHKPNFGFKFPKGWLVEQDAFKSDKF